MSKPRPFSPDEREYYEGKIDFNELMRRQSGDTSMTTYTLRYNPMHSFTSSQEETATAHSLEELIALIDEHVIEDDYCWIFLHEDGVETGRGQYYHVVAPGRVVDGIEEQDAARGLCERINAVEQAALDAMKGQAR